MLWAKMFRDLKENRGAYIACLVIIIIGLMIYTSFSMVIDNLTLSKNTFYQNQNFADGFADVQAIPFSEVSHLRDTPGIKDIQGRIVKDVQVLLPQREENVYLRLVSVDPNEANPINGVNLSQGIPLTNEESNIWIDNKFYEANKLSLNDELNIIAEGKKKSLQVVGVGISPEFVYALRTSSDLYPSPESFGVAFIPREIMQRLFPTQAAINSLVFTLEPDAQYNSVEERLESKLDRFGLTRLYPRKDQTSHLLLTGEIDGLESMATALPTFFLAVAGMILYIMLKRTVEQQRGQIGILKAFGFTYREILLHYLSYAVVLGAAGGIFGGLTGIALSYPFTDMYEMFFSLPGLKSSFSPGYLITGILLSLLFSLFAGYQGCKKILRLEPAEAMRPPAPPDAKKVLLERISIFWAMLTVQGKMAVRNISRNKGRSVFIFLGIMFSFAILGFTWSMNDLVQKMLFDQYEKIETYDVKVTLVAPGTEGKIQRELYNFPGVNKVEALAEVPVTLKNNWHKEDVLMLGIPNDSSLYHILDKDYNKVSPPVDGILLSERLAGLLNARVGTSLKVKNLLLRETEKEKYLEVVGIIPQYLGSNSYMELTALQKFTGQKDLATSFMVSMEQSKVEPLQKEYRQSAVIAGIDNQKKRLQQSQELMASYGSMIYIYALIGIIISFAIIYNSSVITLSERSHELASMRVLGMTPAEVLSVITFEQWFIAFFAILGGIPMSKMFLEGISQSISNDVYTMPTGITPSSFAIAFFVTVVSIWVAQRIAARKIARMSLVEALKAHE
ncbi:FtsX-like permease family protein [Metallumcola ferriviriculae]|uniref:FtsX-like permease family protein n=1 Tax=Metallumcola ferriviriculae TaxID=3039180 RepID=A0AAU0UMA2_9FIRM|nr:FtsX-like permease family protein [Desulfitibacteraceae bacterium MK1]